MTHTLSCSKGGLVIARHNKVCDELLYLSGRALTSESVCAEPLTHQVRTISERNIRQGSGREKETKEDVMTQGLWYRQADAIVDVKFGDADTDSYKYEPMATLLDWWETTKKDKNGKNCHNQQKYFSLFVISVKRMLGRKSLVVIAQLIRTMAAKMGRPISHIRGWINGRITITVPRSYSNMIRGA